MIKEFMNNNIVKWQGGVLAPNGKIYLVDSLKTRRKKSIIKILYEK
jgi:hypothetical protein